jgi:diadenosine tetraphosphate (Ap4A) HIT family hydrolase
VVNDSGCIFCTVISALQQSDSYQSPDTGTCFQKIQSLPASIAVLGPDQYHTGYTLVIAKTHATELYQLSGRESTQYVHDMARVAHALDRVLHPQKMNYELLGSTVAHLHWHPFPRYDWDPNLKSPTWEQPHPAQILSAEECAERIAAIRQQLS